jgi:hypothetical protein
MTSPIGQSGRDQKEAGGDMPAEERITSAARPTAPGNSGPANEPAVSDDERIVPDAGRAAPGDSAPDDERIVPDDERVVPDDERIVPDDERIVPDDERIVVLDDDPLVLDDDQDVLDKDDVASEGGSAAAASAAAGPSSELTPGSAAARRSVSEGTRPGGRWPEIQSMFVDDPRASVELAAELIDDSVQMLIASVKERQHALLSSWQGTGASTEELRSALRAYRTFWHQIDSFCQDA